MSNYVSDGDVMSVFCLKIIALITMIIDHYGAIFEGHVHMYRIIGRIAFPIYCFLLTEGYLHTKDVKKYALRLFIFALISELPFDLAFFEELGFEHQNIFFTLFIGLIAIHVIHIASEKSMKQRLAVTALAIIISFAAASLLRVDYKIIGIIYILAFYLTRNLPKHQRFFAVAAAMLITNFIMSASVLQQYSLISLIFLYFYNKEPGLSNKLLQLSFYAAYPIHLFIFYLMRIL